MLAHSHESEDEQKTGATVTTKMQDVQPQGLQLNVTLDVRALDSRDEYSQSAILPLAGIGVLRQDDLMWGRSSIGLQWRDAIQGYATDAEVSTAYSDQEQRMLLDHARVGLAFDPHWRADLGRMNPLFADQAKVWPVTDLMMQGLLGDDHWHADGMSVTYRDAQPDHLSAQFGLYGKGAYVGSQGDIGLWTLGAAWRPLTQPNLKLSASVGYVPDVIRQSSIEQSRIPLPHSHDTNVSACGQSLTCVDGDSRFVWLSARWQPLQHVPQASVGLYGLLRRESGQLNGPNGVVDYQGDLGAVVIEGLYPIMSEWQLGARYEWLSIQHEVHGPNASMVSRDAGLSDNAHTPERLGLMLSYSGLDHSRVNLAVFDDRTRVKADTLVSLGLVFDGQMRVW